MTRVMAIHRRAKSREITFLQHRPEPRPDRFGQLPPPGELHKRTSRRMIFSKTQDVLLLRPAQAIVQLIARKLRILPVDRTHFTRQPIAGLPEFPMEDIRKDACSASGGGDDGPLVILRTQPRPQTQADGV